MVRLITQPASPLSIRNQCAARITISARRHRSESLPKRAIISGLLTVVGFVGSAYRARQKSTRLQNSANSGASGPATSRIARRVNSIGPLNPRSRRT
jgi:hypothetical protein